MFKLNNDFLTSLGLGSLPVDEKNKLLQAIYERLEMNVGMRLADKMTDAQLDEFEGFIDRNDEAGALRWLETNFPNYKQVVAEELEKLKKEVSASAPQILAAAQSANTQPPMAAPSVPGTMPTEMPGQPASPSAYNPENPFQSNNPEFGKSVGQAESNVQPVMPSMVQPTAGHPQFTQPDAGMQSPQPATGLGAAPVSDNFSPAAPSQSSQNPFQPQVTQPDPTVQQPQQPNQVPANPATNDPFGSVPSQQPPAGSQPFMPAPDQGQPQPGSFTPPPVQ